MKKLRKKYGKAFKTNIKYGKTCKECGKLIKLIQSIE